ncbi:hypothetical protein [Pyxidicoccus xibeiensis]|uniref:hypothetical protein n=1 Tax=Pyxidicoccus xibeiensis TaxID=2906759 RepID=UPI0020A8102E|nr:hypothetical protein [Pyxidicoccus xibeiensis]MCP3143386.1 hypothetical protein [Pyxidicoccus xibeiensis]
MTASYDSGARTGASGCGCGGGGAGAPGGGCGCGCGKGAMSLNAPVSSSMFMRPRFFPGQLLTEDDLEQLVAYTTAKERLHNRFLFGEGVVAGLRVSTVPGSKGFVRVDGGYALDSHGNDLVVPCPVDLDINKLARDLVRARLGHECPAVVEPPPGNSEPRGKPLPRREGEEGLGGEMPGKPTRAYALYVRYHEQSVEPVAPYATGDDPCAAQACQFSRVQEGYVFELRCYEPNWRRPGFLHAVQQCAGGKEDDPLPRANDVELMERRARALREAVDRVPPPAVHEEEGTLVGTYSLTAEDAAAAEALSEAGRPSDLPVTEKVAALERMASLVARYDLREDTDTSDESFEVLRSWIHGEAGAPGLAEEVLTEARGAGLSPLVRETAASVAEAARRWTGERGPDDWGTAYPHRLLAGGAAMEDGTQAALGAAVGGLARRLASSAHGRVAPRGERALAEAARALASAPRKLDDLEVRRTADVLERGAEVGGEYNRECLCGALHPPFCLPGDPAVMLARIHVRDCEVVELCDLERQFVLSPAAMQYWVGSALHAAMEDACCPPPEEPLPDNWLQPHDMPRARTKRAPGRGLEQGPLLDLLVRTFQPRTRSGTAYTVAGERPTSGAVRTPQAGGARSDRAEARPELLATPAPSAEPAQAPAPPSMGEERVAAALKVRTPSGTGDTRPATPGGGRPVRKGGARGGGRRG